MIATCRDCGVVIDGGSSPLIAMGPEETANRLDVEWWTLAEFVFQHLMAYHPDNAKFLAAGAHSIVLLEAMRLVSSSDSNVTALLTNQLAAVCDRFSPAPV